MSGSTVRPRTYEQSCLDALRRSGDWMTAVEVAESARIYRSSARNALRKLLRKGLVQRRGDFLSEWRAVGEHRG